ncbi:putative defense protein 3 [Penaeus japonicus]|uniref:putative defense protein 3 n=1 Tax=Penaeus japonicus TaxID=27405 RepID=UPI001C713B3B|nr:putative defense protein 3 [Penaeus japonicus]
MLVLLPMLTALVGGASAFSSGNVGWACGTMNPGHLFQSAERSPSPFEVYAEEYQDGYYLVTVFGRNDRFKGLLMQAQDPRDQIVGVFVQAEGGQLLDCSYEGGAVSHKDGNPRIEIRAVWHPNSYTGPLKFK